MEEEAEDRGVRDRGVQDRELRKGGGRDGGRSGGERKAVDKPATREPSPYRNPDIERGSIPSSYKGKRSKDKYPDRGMVSLNMPVPRFSHKLEGEEDQALAEYFVGRPPLPLPFPLKRKAAC